MSQTNLFLGEKQEEKVTKLKEKWGKNKHDTILKIIDEFKKWKVLKDFYYWFGLKICLELYYK